MLSSKGCGFLLGIILLSVLGSEEVWKHYEKYMIDKCGYFNTLNNAFTFQTYDSQKSNINTQLHLTSENLRGILNMNEKYSKNNTQFNSTILPADGWNYFEESKNFPANVIVLLIFLGICLLVGIALFIFYICLLCGCPKRKDNERLIRKACGAALIVGLVVLGLGIACIVVNIFHYDDLIRTICIAAQTTKEFITGTTSDSGQQWVGVNTINDRLSEIVKHINTSLSAIPVFDDYVQSKVSLRMKLLTDNLIQNVSDFTINVIDDAKGKKVIGDSSIAYPSTVAQALSSIVIPREKISEILEKVSSSLKDYLTNSKTNSTINNFNSYRTAFLNVSRSAVSFSNSLTSNVFNDFLQGFYVSVLVVVPILLVFAAVLVYVYAMVFCALQSQCEKFFKIILLFSCLLSALGFVLPIIAAVEMIGMGTVCSQIGLFLNGDQDEVIYNIGIGSHKLFSGIIKNCTKTNLTAPMSIIEAANFSISTDINLMREFEYFKRIGKNYILPSEVSLVSTTADKYSNFFKQSSAFVSLDLLTYVKNLEDIVDGKVFDFANVRLTLKDISDPIHLNPGARIHYFYFNIDPDCKASNSTVACINLDFYSLKNETLIPIRGSPIYLSLIFKNSTEMSNIISNLKLYRTSSLELAKEKLNYLANWNQGKLTGLLPDFTFASSALKTGYENVTNQVSSFEGAMNSIVTIKKQTECSGLLNSILNVNRVACFELNDKVITIFALLLVFFVFMMIFNGLMMVGLCCSPQQTTSHKKKTLINESPEMNVAEEEFLSTIPILNELNNDIQLIDAERIGLVGEPIEPEIAYDLHQPIATQFDARRDDYTDIDGDNQVRGDYPSEPLRTYQVTRSVEQMNVPSNDKKTFNFVNLAQQDKVTSPPFMISNQLSQNNLLSNQSKTKNASRNIPSEQLTLNYNSSPYKSVLNISSSSEVTYDRGSQRIKAIQNSNTTKTLEDVYEREELLN